MEIVTFSLSPKHFELALQFQNDVQIKALIYFTECVVSGEDVINYAPLALQYQDIAQVQGLQDLIASSYAHSISSSTLQTPV